MAVYELEWSETIRHKARIEAPPNDERMIEAVATGEAVEWAKKDLAAELTTFVVGEPVVEVTACGRVVEGKVNPL